VWLGVTPNQAGDEIEVDILKHVTPGGSGTSIFDTKPKFTEAAVNSDAYTGTRRNVEKETIDTTNFGGGSGITAMVFDVSEITIDAGEFLSMTINNVGNSRNACNLTASIFTRSVSQ